MTVSVICHISDKSCTTCLLISKSFKELFFMAFFSESGCKGKAYFWTTKTFQKKFSKKVFFEVEVHVSVPLFSISTHLRFSLESGCKSTALRHIFQIIETLFCKYFKDIYLTHWLSKHAVEHKKGRLLPSRKVVYLNFYTHARSSLIV